MPKSIFVTGMAQFSFRLAACKLSRQFDGVKLLPCLQVADDLNPLRVLSLFSAVTSEDCILLDIADRPEYLLMTHIPVPPVCIRPSVDMDSGQGSNEDDLTVRLRVHTCNLLTAV